MDQQEKLNKKVTITTRDGKPMVIPPEGALGLLALGYRGLIAWRQARRERNQALKLQKQNAEKETPAIQTDIEKK